MKILVLGDSTTFGAELSDLPSAPFGAYGNDYVDENTMRKFSPPSKLAWPSLLATKLNCEIVNQSLIGGSNDRIFRIAIEQTLSQPWDLVICAWTAVDRFDLTDGTRDLAITLRSHWGVEWVKQFAATHWNRNRADINFVTKLLALQGFFAQHKQPYLFVRSQDIILCDPAVDLEKHLDHTHCVDWPSDFYQWTQSDPKGFHGHTLEQGHIRIANIMYQHITNKFLIRRDV
jgi:hypothetical protein